MSVTFSPEPATKPLDADSNLLGGSGTSRSDTNGHAASTMPTVLQTSTTKDAATLLSEATNLLDRAAAASGGDSPQQQSISTTPASSSPKAAGAPGSTPTSTRSARKPAVLSVSLHSLDLEDINVKAEPPAQIDSAPSLPSVASSLSPAATITPPLPSQPVNAVKTPPPPPPPAKALPTVVPYTSNPPSAAHTTPVRSTATATVAAAAAPSTAAPAMPLLQLPIKPCADEVTPVKTLYNRLFREAQQREQRQVQAQRKQRAAQKAEEQERCTFHPCGADAFDTSPAAKKKRAASAAAAPTSPAPAAPHDSPSASRTPRVSRSAASTAQEETTACERLYRNAEQEERRERRLRELREAQEEELRAACTFHPCVVSPSRGGRSRSASACRRSSEVQGGSHDGETSVDSHGGKGASVGRSGTSPQRPSRSWEHFLADQEEHQATQERHLKELKKRAAAQDHAKLYTGVPRSKASEHLKAYLEKKKGYKGPIEGWSERFEHYMKVKLAAEADSSAKATTTTTTAGAAASQKKDGAEHTPAGNRSRSRTRSESTGGSPSVFARLYHDSDEREAMRELIRLMKEQHEQTTFFRPNTGETGAGSNNTSNSIAKNDSNNSNLQTPRRSPASPEQADAASATAAAVAVAAGKADEEHLSEQQHASADSPQPHDTSAMAQSIFDTLYAEKEKLQRRREMQHLQAQNDAEVYSFRPHVNTRSRELVKDAARQKARGTHEETVRERRAREAAQAASAEATRRAQVHFRYDTFAHRQAERDRRREEELLHVLLRERTDDVEACRFRPAISEVTEAIVDGNRHYTQVIDDPQAVHNLLAQRAASSAAAAAAAAAASKSAARDGNARAARSVARRSTAPLAVEAAKPAKAVPAKPALTPVQALAADTEEADHSVNAGTSSQFYDVFSAPVNTYSATSSNTSDGGFHRTEQQGKTQSQPPVEVSFSSAKESVSQSPVKQEDGKGELDTVHIAGAASSEYLRQLESELQDALKDWSQFI